ncbi:hypothetical protein C6P41_003556 [Kluyveromyces marxianus]|nr:hypothetical protein C6P43_002629 [Kluyveromyces marxianus]KAG0685758.1 hypothetical protein C6P41_003556 [Kluyveromyces marxianus]
MSWFSKLFTNTAKPASAAMTLSPSTVGAATPVFFVSHGGPTFMYSDKEGGIMGGDYGAFKTVRKLGQTILQDIKPKFIVYVSAHWQSKADNLIEVSVPKSFGKSGFENPLIYDFYGFPQYMYQEQFHSECDISVANDIVNTINHSNTGLKAKLSERGIDHGVWVPLKIAFPNDDLVKNQIPLIQVSLTRNDYDFDSNFKLGELLAEYRSKGGVIITSGMTVHNLGDMRNPGPKPYNEEFTKLLNDILLTKQQNKLGKFKAILQDAKQKELLLKAHPSLEHFLPIIVALGAAEQNGDDVEKIKQLYNNSVESLGWGIYQFGDLL